MRYRPADAWRDGLQDSLVGGQHCLIHHCLVLTEPAIGGEGASDVTVVAVVLAAHVQQQHVIAANLPVCIKRTTKSVSKRQNVFVSVEEQGLQSVCLSA